MRESDEPPQGDIEPRIRVLVVDDHGLVRRGIRSYLAIFDDLEVVGEASDGAQALAGIRSLAAEDRLPHVVLMDLAMAPVDGVLATQHIRAEMPEVEVVALTSLIDQSRVHAALQAGASGYLVKDAEPEELAVAIRAAYRGEMHLDASVARQLMESLRPAAPEGDLFAELSEREREILVLIAEGHANKEVARRLFISERTARTHVSHILGKLGVSSRTQAALLAVREGLMTPRTESAPGRARGR